MSEPEATNAVRPEPIPTRPQLTPEQEERLRYLVSDEFANGLTEAFAAGKRKALKRRDARLAAEAAEVENAPEKVTVDDAFAETTFIWTAR